MKKVFRIALMALVAVFAVTILGSCEHFRNSKTVRLRDSMYFEQQLLKHENPVLQTSDDAESFVATMTGKFKRDSILSSMTEDELYYVSSNLAKTKHHFTPQDIVDEFINNKDVYESLPSKSRREHEEEVDTVLHVRHTKDTVIDGKKMTISYED